MTRTFLRTASITCLLVGPLCGLVAVALFLSTNNFVHHAVHVNGTITKLIPYTDEEGIKTFAPVFSFTPSGGTTLTHESATRQNPPGFAIGDQVPVLVDPGDTRHAEINTAVQLYFAPILLGAFCIVSTLLGALLRRVPQIRTAHLPFLSFFLDK